MKPIMTNTRKEMPINSNIEFCGLPSRCTNLRHTGTESGNKFASSPRMAKSQITCVRCLAVIHLGFMYQETRKHTRLRVAPNTDGGKLYNMQWVLSIIKSKNSRRFKKK